MKMLFISILLTWGCSFVAKGQVDCGIVFSYDDNGYRIDRQKVCPAPKTAPVDSPVHTTGIQPIDSLHISSEFRIYPNPLTTWVNIDLEPASLRLSCSIMVTDVSGRVLKSQSLVSPTTRLDLDGYANGSYFFTLRRGTQVNTVKLVKLTGTD